MGSDTTSPIKERRLAKGLTQEQLAVHAGVTAKTVVNLEKGYYTATPGTLLLLADVLKCDPEDLA